MTYGERLQAAMDRRSAQIGRKVVRREVAAAAGCSPQNIGMIITGAQGTDQKLSTESHSKVAAFLKVNPDWLLKEVGSIEPPSSGDPVSLSHSAKEIGALFDMIPHEDIVKRAIAYNAATTAIMQALKPDESSDL